MIIVNTETKALKKDKKPTIIGTLKTPLLLSTLSFIHFLSLDKIYYTYSFLVLHSEALVLLDQLLNSSNITQFTVYNS